jgi:hypothetical protein
VLVVVGLLTDGGLYFVGLLVFNREVLQTEPGAVNAFMYRRSGRGGGGI